MDPSIVRTGTTKQVVARVVEMLKDKHVSLKKTYGKPIVCFDVDECLLEWTGENSSRRRKDVAPLYEATKELGFKLYIITARPKTKNGLVYLRNQLETLGYDPDEFENLYMMPREYSDPGVFKSEARAHIRRKTGRDIVLMVGDQPTDVLKDPDHSKISFGKTRAYIVSNPDKGLLLGVKVSEIA